MCVYTYTYIYIYIYISQTKNTPLTQASATRSRSGNRVPAGGLRPVCLQPFRVWGHSFSGSIAASSGMARRRSVIIML